ncbi:MAG: PorV/PorQ family protein [Odoribacteraceae bacterium]|jgi:hypothetical protein|nr:PorV/PorQ family protein [Odoribacteraceae bacterium]
MKKRITGTWIASLFALSLPAQTGSALFLTVPVDARSSGMGGTGVALLAGAFTVFHNPATLPFEEGRAGAGDSHVPWLSALLPGGFLNGAGAYYRVNDRGGIATGFRYFAHPGGTGYNEETGVAGSLRPVEWTVEVAYARRWLDRLGVSVTSRYIRSDMGERAAGAVAFDAGLFYRGFFPLPRATWAAGFHVSNVGSQLRYASRGDHLPARATLGGSLALLFRGQHEVRGAVDLIYRLLPARGSRVAAAVGAEYGFRSCGTLRAGYHAGGGSDDYATLGGGFRVAPVSCHFSYWLAASSSALRNTWGVSVELVFW